MNLEIQYLKKVDKFFSKNSHILSKEKTKELVIKSIKKIVLKEDINVDVKQLKGYLQHFYRIRSGKVRILFELVNQEVKIITIVTDVDFRGDVYK
ncbi:type II toxin-antitoxin system RelE/ParE family toxin [Arcobacter sp. YIC-80]|uniref:type II toxin-antitoxin system RelE family toxin n=1 Tax=Arcobacter sp. YIC-80 TaxID=3376683 RepID=UPI00384DAE85